MKKLSFFFLLALSINIMYGQNLLNEYKYIIIPIKFESFQETNQYQTSTLLKHLFDQKGFNVVYSDNLPEDLSNNMCLGLLADIMDNSNMFTTKTTIILKDCTFKEVFVAQEGKSKLKDYKPAYNEGITNSFKSFVGMNYAYIPKTKTEEPITVSFKNDVKKIEEKPAEVIVNSEIEKTPTVEEAMEVVENVEKIVDATPTVEEIKEEGARIIPVAEASGILYAQQLSNGYQLVDSKPSIRLKMYKSSVPNVYYASDNGVNGLVYNKDGKWFFEYYKNEKLLVEELNIKF